MQFQRVSTALLLGMSLAGITAPAQLRAGAGKSDIKTTPDMWPVDGFTVQHDPLAARVLLVANKDSSAAIVVIDQTSINDGSIAKAKATVTRLAGVPGENTIVVASHTFSSPHVFGGGPPGGPGHGPGGPGGAQGPPRPAPDPGTSAFAKAIDDAVVAATQQAKLFLQPATVGFGTATTAIAVNRDIKTPQGWWLGGDAAGFTDTSVPVVRFNAADGKPIAVLINEAVQSSVMDHSEYAAGGKAITSDVAGAATRYVEQQYGGGTVALFLIGAAGDQAPILQGNHYVLQPDGSTQRVDLHEAGFTLVDLLGDRLGAEAVATADMIRTTPASAIQVVRKTIQVDSQTGSRGLPDKPTLEYTYTKGDKVTVPVVMMRIGDVAIVGLQAELAASVGAQIKKNSPFANTLVVTMVDGSAKYMPDSKSYPEFSYEARNSRYAQGTAEKVGADIDGFLQSMK